MNRYYAKRADSRNGVETGASYLCRETNTADGPLYCPDSRNEDFCGEWCPFFELKETAPECTLRVTLSCRHIQRYFILDPLELDDEEV